MMLLMLPREHGAYGQFLFPLVTALAVSGMRLPALLIGFAALACFLAHEPVLVLLGRRGPRSCQDQSGTAKVMLLALGISTATAGGLAFAWLPAPQRWSLLVPVVPALFVLLAILRGREKAWPAEVAVSIALSTVAFPVAIGAGAAVDAAVTIAIAFGTTFVLATLAVQTVILRVRAGGNPPAVRAMRCALVAVAVGIALAVTAACLRQQLPWTALVAVIPGIFVSIPLAAWPLPPSRLREVGWMLMAASALTSVILIAGLR